MFNLELFGLKLNTNYIGRNFIYFEEIDSTNTYLLNKDNEIDISGTVVLADFQSKGRGRMDRVWTSDSGQNLLFSILFLNNPKLFQLLNFLNFSAALAVASSIENLYQLKPELKWPNDILISRKKTCGILVESVSSKNTIERVVVGIGVNVNQNHFKGEYNFPPTSIRIELGKEVERERLLAEILNNLETNINKLKTNKNQILNDWKSRCKMIGEKISIRQKEDTKFGVFEDIDENGFLLLKTKAGIEKITAGDLIIQ
jgi:BirA family biotin operon repressor/biotin-[acetyl-CoA-carboxylase] ligase